MDTWNHIYSAVAPIIATISNIKRSDLQSEEKSSSSEMIGLLERMMLELEAKDKRIAVREEMLHNITDALSVAVWAKDVDGKFVYANHVCCKAILKCTEAEAIAMTDADFEHDALAQACIESDREVMNRRETLRFIEHAQYADGDIWIDVIKSPWINGDVVIGVVGTGVNITHKIPSDVLERCKEARSNEIPIDAEFNRTLLDELI